MPPATPVPPGGTLDLHEGLGQPALKKAGLLAEFRALSRPEGQAMRILDTRIDRALAYPSGLVSNLIFCRSQRELSAGEVVGRALAHRAVAS